MPVLLNLDNEYRANLLVADIARPCCMVRLNDKLAVHTLRQVKAGPQST